jgi:putative permease
MIELLSRWYYRYFSDPQAVLLTLILVLGTTIILTMGNMLAPALAAIVIAYLLEGIVRVMEKRKVKRIRAVILVYSVFSAFVIFLLFGVIPLISIQVTALFKELPQHLAVAQNALMALPQHYSFISEQNVQEFSTMLNNEIASLGQHILSVSLASVSSFVTVLVYLVLVPLLVFFFLKDKSLIIRWFSGLLPRDRQAASQVWHEMDAQLGNYVRGKFWEILIVGSVSYIAFAILGLKYSILMAVLVGLSVIVPYIGATVVTLPVIVVGYFQWGWGSEFAVLMIVYGIIQALDGNVLVPLLFSNAVNLHPIAIIVSILVFGGLWGFWGVFFAIPLATLVNAVLAAWPKVGDPPQVNTA